jgi:hypothetical protein
MSYLNFSLIFALVLSMATQAHAAGAAGAAEVPEVPGSPAERRRTQPLNLAPERPTPATNQEALTEDQRIRIAAMNAQLNNGINTAFAWQTFMDLLSSLQQRDHLQICTGA